MREPTDSTIDILIVDDREDGLVALEAVLGHQQNYNLVKAGSGREALKTLPHYDFAMILLDVQMPELDGFETAELIRAQSQFQSIPILFVTAINKDDKYVYRGFEVGAVDYIFKPLDPMILRSKVAVFADLHLKNRKIKQQAMQLVEREILAQMAKSQAQELESLSRYRRLADAIPHIVFRALHPDRLEYHNAVWTEYSGLSSAESLGSGWQKAVEPRDLPGLLQAWLSALKGATAFEVEVRLKRQSGESRWHWFKCEPEFEQLGGERRLVAWLATGTDIHDRKMAEKGMIEARKNAEAANEAKTRFLANMSHEIRTPLNAIMGFSELLVDPDVSPDEKRTGASIIWRNSKQLLRIVDEILDISKVEAGGLQLEYIETSIPDLLSEVKTLMSAQAGKKGLELIFDISKDIPPRVFTDSTRLRQIALNVIGNAIKFTSAGSVTVKTAVVNAGETPLLHIEVADTGFGIDPSSTERIFEPFSQADSSTTRLFGGTGLGLAISRRLALALGGDVRLLSSQVGSGSRFEIEIPLSTSGDSMKRRTQANEEQAQPQQASELRGKRILLVEDAEDNQCLIAKYLDPYEVTVDIASNGREGITKALAGDYEAILMDIQMPQMDGYQATARLRQAGYRRPIIALTAYALAEEREKSLRHGCNAHLTKPIDRRRLIESLASAIRDGSVR